jgi:hypothetical protein
MRNSKTVPVPAASKKPVFFLTELNDMSPDYFDYLNLAFGTKVKSVKSKKK